MEKKKTLKPLFIVLGILAIVGMFIIALCKTGEKGDKGDQGIQGVAGEQGLQGETGAQGAQGEPGDDGIDGQDGLTPFIGANGNWWIGTIDTGVSATGKDGANGLTPLVGPNGTWWIGQVDTGVSANGNKGDKGDQGVSVVKVELDSHGNLIFHFSDGSTYKIAIPDFSDPPSTPDSPDAPEEEHVHSFGAWMEYHEPGTENRGFVRVCPGCGQVEWQKDDYLEHDWTVVTTAPTCYSKGYDTKTCTHCGRVERDNYTAKVGHTWSKSYTYNTAYHWHACTVCEEAQQLLAHSVSDNGDCNECGCIVSPSGGVLYDVSADGTYVEVIGYEGSAAKVKIAETYKGLPVTGIYKDAFAGKSSITELIIPDSVTKIGENAFYGCNSLVEITLPFVGASQNATGYESVFGYIFGYTTSSYNGGTLQYSEYSSGSSYSTSYYYYIPSSLKKVTVTSATAIPNKAFYNCSNLTSVTMPNGVTSIGDSAFNYCRNLTSIAIPDSVTNIGNDAFYNCSSLTSVYIKDLAAWCNISFNNSYANPLNYAEKLYVNNELVTEVVIPNGVTEIKAYAFRGYTGLASVIIPNSVTKIAECAFYDCTSLASVSFGNGAATIGSSAFAYCDSLTGLEIPDSVTSIEYDAFYDCDGLTSVEIPDSVTSIGSSVFAYCDSLTGVSIGNGITELPSSLFNGCSKLVMVEIPDGITSVSSSVFEGCSSLIFNEYENCQYLGNKSNPYYALIKVKGNNYSTYTIHENAKVIAAYAFQGCERVGNITIPDSVVTIGYYAFEDCYSLTSVVIGDSVTTIEYNAFYNCNSLVILCKAESKPSGWDWSWNNSNRPVYWGWVDAREYTYTFETNGGVPIKAVTSKYPVVLPTPSKDGYWFGGWYDNVEFKGKDYSIYYASSDITLYAQWFDTEAAYLEWWYDGSTYERAVQLNLDEEVVFENAGDVVYFVFTCSEQEVSEYYKFYFALYSNYSIDIDLEVKSGGWSSDGYSRYSGYFEVWHYEKTCYLKVTRRDSDVAVEDFTITCKIAKDDIYIY